MNAPAPELESASAAALRLQRLKDDLELIDRFTVLSRKQIAGELGALAIEAGGRAGELTLF